MKAMILAAGLGTRLKPLTDTIPKALVEVNGVPMLERVILTLKNQGFNEIVVNVHHFSQMIIEFLKEKKFGVNILISDESNQLLDTGGGIVKAMPILFKYDRIPVLFHNVDILSNADLGKVINESKSNSKGVLLVNDRNSSRKLICDQEMNLRGWHDLKNENYRPEGIERELDSNLKELAFSGIYALTYENIDEMRKLMGDVKYSVMDYFLNPSRKVAIKGLEQKDLKLLDIGKPATLSQASELLEYCYNKF